MIDHTLGRGVTKTEWSTEDFQRLKDDEGVETGQSEKLDDQHSAEAAFYGNTSELFWSSKKNAVKASMWFHTDDFHSVTGFRFNTGI